MDDLEEEATEGAITMGGANEEDGKVAVLSAAEVRVISPRVVFLDVDDNL